MNRKRASCLSLGAVLILLGGCMTRETAERARFVIEAERETADASSGELVLEVRNFHVVPTYAGTEFVYRRPGGSFESDFYSIFMVSPGSMFAAECRDWMRRSGLFRLVGGGGSRALPSHVLEGDITAIYADRSTVEGIAVLEVRMALLRDSDDEVLFQSDFKRRMPLDDDEPSTLVGGWNRAMASILEELEAEVRRAL